MADYSQTTKINIALKNLLSKSQTDNAKTLNNEAENIFFNIYQDYVFTDVIDSDPNISIANGTVEFISNAILTIDPTSNSHSFFATYPVSHPKNGQRIRNAISPAFGYQYEAIPYASGNRIFSGDARGWLYQYNSGIFFQDNLGGSTPTTIDVYVYIGNTLTVELASGATASGLTILSAETWSAINELDNLVSNALSTGILTGGILSINSNPSKFDLSAGYGYIIDNTTVPLNPVRTLIHWDNFTGQTSPYLNISDETFVAIDINGNIFYSQTDFTYVQLRQYIIIGWMKHKNFSTINEILSEPMFVPDIQVQFHSFLIAHGPFNIQGNDYSANDNNLLLNRNSGSVFDMGSNYINDKRQPNITISNSNSALTFQYFYRISGGTAWNNSISTGITINPNYYDNGNGIVLFSSGWTIQRIYYYAPTNSTSILYGQEIYPDLITSLNSMNIPIQENNYLEESIFRCWLFVQHGTTNLSDSGTTKFISAGKTISESGSGGGSGEINTASNIGTQGIGVYTQKVGADLQFKNISAGNFTTVDLDSNNNIIVDTNITGYTSLINNDITKLYNTWTDTTRRGFRNQTDTTISFDGISTFTLAPTGSTWSYYYNGLICNISGSKTIQIDLNNTTPYFIYIDSNDGNLLSSTTSWTILDTKCMVATIYANNTCTPSWLLQEERHTILIDTRVHALIHHTEGTKFDDGGELNNLILNSDNDLNKRPIINETIIYDEDIISTLSQLTPSAITSTNDYFNEYRAGFGSWIWKTSNMPFVYNAGTNWIQYDNNGSITDGTSGNWYNSYLLYVPQSGVSRYTFVPGRGEFGSLALAQAEDSKEFDWSDLNSSEAVIGWQLTWYADNSYISQGHCVYVGSRKINVGYTTTKETIINPSHNALSDKQGGLLPNQFYHLNLSDYNTLLQSTGNTLNLSSQTWNAINSLTANTQNYYLSANTSFYTQIQANNNFTSASTTNILSSQTWNSINNINSVLVVNSDILGVGLNISASTGIYTGTGNTFLGNLAGYNSIIGSNNNTLIGHSAGNNISGNDNIFIGNSTGLNSQGNNNIFIGDGVGLVNQGDNNIFISENAGQANTTGFRNIFIGNNTGYHSTTADNNAYIGDNAGYTNIIGHSNVFLGYNAGYYEIGSNKLYISNSSTVTPLIYGDFLLSSVTINGTLVGYYTTTQTNNNFTSASTTNTLSSETWSAITNNTSNIFTLSSETWGEINNNYINITILSADTWNNISFVENNIVITDNLGIGLNISASTGVYQGLYNTMIGTYAGYNLNADNANNTMIGYQAGTNLNGNSNIFIGMAAGSNSIGDRNIFIGNGAGDSNNNSDNIFIGDQTGVVNNTGYQNIFIGTNAGLNNIDGFNNLNIGFNAGLSNISGSGNTCLGINAGNASISDNNVYIGYNAGFQTSTGGNTVVGYNATCAYNAIYSVVLGNNAGGLSYGSIAIGAYSANNSNSQNCIFIGDHAGFNSTGGLWNTIIGYYSAYDANGNASGNTILGSYAGYNNAHGKINTFIGEHAGFNNDVGIQNTYVGCFAGFNGNTSTVRFNTNLGSFAGYLNVSGGSNVFIGYQAGYNEIGSGKLYIANNNTTTPLIFGNFNLSSVTINNTLNVTGNINGYYNSAQTNANFLSANTSLSGLTKSLADTLYINTGQTGVLFYTITQSNANFLSANTSLSGLTRSLADTLYLNTGQTGNWLSANTSFYTQTETNVNFLSANTSFYTQVETNSNFLSASTNLFTRTQADLIYLNSGQSYLSANTSFYTQAQANSNFLSANTSYYTQAQANSNFLSANTAYVTTGTTQNISGLKTFTSGINITGITQNYGDIYITGNTYSTGNINTLVLKTNGGNAGSGYFFSGSTSTPSNSTILNYDGYLYATRFVAYNSGDGIRSIQAFGGGTTGVGIYANTTAAIGAKFEITGSGSGALATALQISNSLTVNGIITSGKLIDIEDNPTLNSNNVFTKILSATIDNTERLYFAPRTQDSDTTTAYMFDTSSALTYSKLFSLRNFGNERLYIDSFGNINLSNISSSIGIVRNTSAITGSSLTISAGGAATGMTDARGGMLYLKGGQTTGSGYTSVRLQRYGRSLTSGSTVDNTIYDAVIVTSEKILQNNIATDLYQITLPVSGMCQGTIEYGLSCTNNIDFQSHAGYVTYAAINKNGVYTANINESSLSISYSNTGTTIFDTWYINTSNNIATINVNVNSSFINPTIKIYYKIHNGSNQTITQL